jgi:hypothetical protein
VIPSSRAVRAIASYSSRVSPGWTFSKSQPSRFCCLTISAACAGELTELPLKLGPAR